MARPADAVREVEERLRDLWDCLVKNEKSFRKGDDKRFYELVETCFDKLWVGDVESTWQTQWKEKVVWKRLEGLEPGEAERRIRETVWPGLREARRLKYTRSDVTKGVESLGGYVDRWFGGQETQAAKQATADTSASAPPAAAAAPAAKQAGSGDKLRDMLDELRRLVEKYAKS